MAVEVEMNGGSRHVIVRAEVTQSIRVRTSEQFVADVERSVRPRLGDDSLVIDQAHGPEPDSLICLTCSNSKNRSASLLKEIEALATLDAERGPRSRDRPPRSAASTRFAAISTSNLTPWQRVQVARHPARPTTLDYVERLFTDFVELHGDRRFADDHAIVTGTALYKGEPILVVGHQKGSDTKQKIYRNFGYARPDGYRKAMRTMEMAQKFGRPIICFVDTPAAYPGIESEERGVAEAIALNLREMAMLEVPVIVLVHGEGGSGGALGIAVGDRILMHEFAIYSVIPPEGCAAILWRDASQEGRSGGGAEDHGAGPAAARHHRRDRQRAGRRRAHQSRRRPRRCWTWPCQRALAEVSALDVRDAARRRVREVPQDGLGGIIESDVSS